MIKNRIHCILLILLIFWALSSFFERHAPSAEPERTRVTERVLQRLDLDGDYHKCIAVADGDTITLEGLGNVRFIGVDTPEKIHPTLPEQFMAKEASLFTRNLCLGKRIRLEYDPFDADNRGNYGRILAYLYLDDGTFVQEQLLKNGYAALYAKYPFDPQKRKAFFNWEEKAKRERMGLWKDDGMGELFWILERKQLMIQIKRSSGGSYQLQLGNWVSKPFKRREIVDHIKTLYQTAYELGPGDLKSRLGKMGYIRKDQRQNSGHSVFVMGMAHRKWSILFENKAKPRISEAELESQVDELNNWINNLSHQARQATLSLNGYHSIPKNLLLNANPVEIAESFLRSDRIGPSHKGLISWESAGRYMGKRMSVQGKIVRTFNSGDACFLNFHRNFTRYPSLVIFEKRFSRFQDPPEKRYLNKTIRVTGKIREHEGRPEILVERPGQIEIIPLGDAQ